jgi:hypothetical protein
MEQRGKATLARFETGYFETKLRHGLKLFPEAEKARRTGRIIACASPKLVYLPSPNRTRLNHDFIITPPLA